MKRKKRSSPKMEDFFPRIQVRTKKGFHQKWNQARSQKFARGGGLIFESGGGGSRRRRPWGLGAKTPAAGGRGGAGLGAEPPALENFAFFLQK